MNISTAALLLAIIPSVIAQDAYFRIQGVGTSQFISVNSCSVGAGVRQEGLRENDDKQLWFWDTTTPTGTSTATRLVNKGCGLVIMPPPNCDDSAAFTLADHLTGPEYQKWWLEDGGDDKFFIWHKVCENKLIGDWGANGTLLQFTGKNGSDYTKWKFVGYTPLAPLPTSSPTASPTTSPTSAPTSSPTFSPTNAPTAAPTSSPTITQAKQNSWYIANNGNATEEATSKDTITICLPFNSTNRDIGALVFDKDCVTAFNSTNYFVARTTLPTSSQPDGYIQFNTTLEMNVTAINGTQHWNPFTDGTRGGWVEVCAETFLSFKDDIDLGNNDTTSKVVFKNNVMNISVSLTANYEIDNISSQREIATQSDVKTDYSEFIVAYECDEADLYIKKTTAVYNQGDEIAICVRDESGNIVEVEEFVNLVVSQADNTDYNFILNGLWNPDITTPRCVDSTAALKARVCYAKVRTLARFFTTETPSDLIISGSVNVRKDGRRVRRILRSALPTTEKKNEDEDLYDSSRRVEEDPGSGEFEVKVSLASADNSAASACTDGITISDLMSVVVGAAGVTGAALML